MRLPWVLLLLAVGCGGRVIDADEGEGRERGSRTGSGSSEPGKGSVGGPVEGGGTLSKGGNGAAEGGQTGSESMPEMGGAEGMAPPSANWFRLDAAHLNVEPYVSDTVTVFSVVPLPETSTVTANLDGVSIRTGVAGLMVFLLDECEAAGTNTQHCRVKVGTFGGGPSGTLGSGNPLDLRLSGYASQTEIYGDTLVVDGAWSTSIFPDEMYLDVGRWEGEVIDEQYDGDELVFINVSQDDLVQYKLPIQKIAVECTNTECSVVVFAEDV